MFFRYNEEILSDQELVPNLFSIEGIAESDVGTIAAILVDEKEEMIFDTDLDGAADATRVKTSAVKPAPIDPEAAYHLAVSFETTDAGVVIAKVFLKAGHGAVNSKAHEDLVSQVGFSVINEDPEKTLQSGSSSIGATRGHRQQRSSLMLQRFGFQACSCDLSGYLRQ